MPSRLLKTVLVVDDNERIRIWTARVLNEFGYSVRTAGDGQSALREIRVQSPDILLTDLQMPGMSGRELLANVRRLDPEIKLLATSGSFCGKDIPKGVLADAFYPKGSGVSVLLQILRGLPGLETRAPQPLTTAALKLESTEAFALREM